MTDPVPSGEPAATDASRPAAQPEAPAGFGAFGSNRGSGLARGKRASAPAATAAAKPSANAAEYQPTAVEVITPPREYENPFGGATSVAPPPEPTPTPVPVSEAAVERVVPSAAAADAAMEIGAASPAMGAVAPSLASEPDEPAGKAELNILPPNEVRREPMSWEHQEERPIFKPERRSSESGASGGNAYGDRRDRGERSGRSDRSDRSGRDSRYRPESGAPDERAEGSGSAPDDGATARREETGSPGRGEGYRRDRGERGERGSRPEWSEGRSREGGYQGRRDGPSRSSTPERRPESTPKPRGFIAWLKGLFAGDKAVGETAGPDQGQRHRDHGRGHGQGSGSGGGEQGQGGSGEGGGHRRRHRGGRGRYRGDWQGGPGGERREGDFRSRDAAPGDQRPSGPSDAPSGEAPGSGGSEPGSDRGGGDFRGGDRREGGGDGHRRRHRGGRGRHRGGDRGDRGGGPRPEGQQGGGYI